MRHRQPWLSPLSSMVMLSAVLFSLPQGVMAQPYLMAESHSQPPHGFSSGAKQATGCPPSALDQAISHTVQPGETLASIAADYDLLPASIATLNPSIDMATLAAGDRLQIPPYNGSLLRVPAGTTWTDLGQAYGIRADVLFESNGCTPTPPETIFVAGIDRASPQGLTGGSTASASTPLEPQTFNTLPVAVRAPGGLTIGQDYGWQHTTERPTPAFHSGIDFQVPLDTPVQAVGDGTVAFAGERGEYGLLVVINHARGVQTRYAQLSTIDVEVGDPVTEGDLIGLSGASGGAETPHLHFETRLNSPSGWVAQNPQLYLNTLDR